MIGDDDAAAQGQKAEFDLAAEEKYGLDDVQVKCIHGGKCYKEEDVREFEQELNEFLAGHDIYDLEIMRGNSKHGSLRDLEAWIVYRKDEEV